MLLEAVPMLIPGKDRQTSDLLYLAGNAIAYVKCSCDIEERRYEWACNAVNDETTHEATYGTDGFDLAHSGKEIAHGENEGIWVELYRKQGTWAPV